MQLAAQARLESLVLRMLRGVGRDRRRILGMEVAPPVDVVAQEFDDEFLEQAVVLAVRTEKAGVEHAPLRLIAARLGTCDGHAGRVACLRSGPRSLHGGCQGHAGIRRAAAGLRDCGPQLLGEAVVDVAMLGLVGAHGDDDVAQAGVGRQAPVVERDLRRGHVLDLARVDLLQVLGVADHRLLLEVADQAMRGARGETYSSRKKVKKPACAISTSARSSQFGRAISMKVIRCMRSFSASSISVRIQPSSSRIQRRQRRWISAAPTMPGTAATVSSTIARLP